MAILATRSGASTRTAARIAPSRIGGLLVTLVALAVLCFLSMAIGTRSTSLPTVWSALTAFDPASTDHLVISRK